MVITCKIKLSPRERNMYEGKQGKTTADMMRAMTLVADNKKAKSFIETEKKSFLSLRSGYSLNGYTKILKALAAQNVTLTDVTIESPVEYKKIKLPLFSTGLYKKEFCELNETNDALSALGINNTQSVYCFAAALSKEDCLNKVFSWTEPTLVTYTNSVLGAKSHIGPDLMALAQCVTGLTPLCGAVDDENRIPQIQISLSLKTLPCAQVLGAAIAKASGGKVPLILGLDELLKDMDKHQKTTYLIDFSKGFSAECNIPLFHAYGVTAEIDDMTIDEKSLQKANFSETDINNYVAEINADKPNCKKNFPSEIGYAPICSLPSAKKMNTSTSDVIIAKSTNAKFKVKGE